uniref:Uncharacterized protein n=1 Tax=viral metagenome TaxID=1070528 RepID=A0A6C0CMH1_9ZZZZ
MNSKIPPPSHTKDETPSPDEEVLSRLGPYTNTERRKELLETIAKNDQKMKEYAETHKLSTEGSGRALNYGTGITSSKEGQMNALKRFRPISKTTAAMESEKRRQLRRKAENEIYAKKKQAAAELAKKQRAERAKQAARLDQGQLREQRQKFLDRFK